MEIEDEPLDEEAASILGHEPGCKPAEEADLHPAIIRRRQIVLKDGLSPEERQALFQDLVIPDDSMLHAPALNPEIHLHLDAVALARDRHLQATQNCLGTALLAHGQAFSCIVANNESLDRPFVLDKLHAADKLLTDIFHQQTQSCRADSAADGYPIYVFFFLGS